MRETPARYILIKSECGWTYAIYTHRNKEFGPDLIQIFDRTFNAPLDDLAVLHSLPIRFGTFTYMPAFMKCEGVRVRGNLGVPEALSAFPLFRASNRNFATRKIVSWWLWDGEKTWQVPEFTPEQRKLSIRSIPSLGLLHLWLDSGWRPEADDDRR